MWDLIVSVPDHCLSFYFSLTMAFLCTNLDRCSITNRIPNTGTM